MKIYQVFFMDADDHLYKRTGFYAVAASAASATALAATENEVPPEFMYRVECIRQLDEHVERPVGSLYLGGTMYNPAGDMRFK